MNNPRSSTPTPSDHVSSNPGIGLAISHHLLSNSHKILAIARTQSSLEKLQKQYPSQVEILPGDLADIALGAKAADIVKSKFGQLDGIIVNHGVLEPVKKVADVEVEDWRKLFDINVFSAVAMVSRQSCNYCDNRVAPMQDIEAREYTDTTLEQIKACIPLLRSSKGRIVLCSSGAATNTYSTWGAYGASKVALNHLAGTLATEEKDITTVSIRPGVVDTDMQGSIRDTHGGYMDPKDAAKFKELKQTGGLLKPEQPGNVMAKLAIDAPQELSGRFLSWNDDALADFQ